MLEHVEEFRCLGVIYKVYYSKIGTARRTFIVGLRSQERL